MKSVKPMPEDEKNNLMIQITRSILPNHTLKCNFHLFLFGIGNCIFHILVILERNSKHIKQLKSNFFDP